MPYTESNTRQEGNSRQHKMKMRQDRKRKVQIQHNRIAREDKTTGHRLEGRQNHREERGQPMKIGENEYRTKNTWKNRKRRREDGGMSSCEGG